MFEKHKYTIQKKCLYIHKPYSHLTELQKRGEHLYMRLPFPLLSRALQQISCRMELMLTRIIFTHLPGESNLHPYHFTARSLLLKNKRPMGHFTMKGTL